MKFKVILACLCFFLFEISYGTYQNERNLNPQTYRFELMTVHVVTHSHMDAGWRKTVDGYYNT